MKNGDIDNRLGPGVAFDYDALIQPPENIRKQALLEKLKNHPKISQKLQPFTIPWSKLDPVTIPVGWWLIEQGYRLVVIVRRPYGFRLPETVTGVLADFASQRVHLVSQPDYGDQGSEISLFCRTQLYSRFFTKDASLCRYLPRSLSFYVRQWDETILM